MVNIYRSYGLKVKEMRSDSESVFIQSEDDINAFGAQLSTAAPSHHEKSIKRLVRAIKEKARSIIFGLPYKICIRIRSAISQFSAKPKDSLLTGKKFDMLTDGRGIFGAAGPYADKKDINARAEEGIIVGRVRNSKGILLVCSEQSN
jgi:hypothetical protein